ncbi:hypothetical protein ABKV19_004453 [Rosa sericea]
MELLEPSMHAVSAFFSFMSSGTDFLLKPIFIRGFSGSLHLLLLFVLLISWVWKKFKGGDGGGDPKEGFRKTEPLHYKPTLICCLGVSAVSVGFCLFNYFSWSRYGWSEEKLVTLFDLAIRTLSWGAVFVYLHTQFSNSGESKFPSLLRVWWGFYFSLSCYCFFIDIVLYQKHVSLPVQSLVSDAAFLISALFFIYVGFIGTKEGRDTLLEEPLLNGTTNSSIGNTAESSKSKGVETVKTPYSNAGFFSILTFSWMSPLIAVGNKKILNLEDVPGLDKGDSVVGSLPIFRNKLESECGTLSRVTTLHLVKALIVLSWREILWTALFALLSTIASYVGPYLIDTFVQYLYGRREFRNEGYALVSAFLGAKVVECLCHRHWFFRGQQIGVRVRAVLVAMIYNKGLNLSCQSKQCHTSGEIINFMTVDAGRVGDFAWCMHEPWTIILQVALALFILYKNLGLGAIATLVATVMVMLANVPFRKLQEKFQTKLMESKDGRMKATSEILRNMRILKLQAWEMKFLSKIIDLRKIETEWLQKYLYTSAMTSFVFWVAPTFVSVVTFVACMLFLEIPLESGKILSVLATFRILQEPVYSLPQTISMIAQTKVSLERISSFLSLDELKPDVIENLPRGSSDTAIEIVDANFSWDISSPNPTLKDINLKISHGMRVAVCGTVGSGKSTLLSCILGEVPKISGFLKLCGTKAYVSQSPWIQSGKIEENILFGKVMDRERYEGVLEACSLKKDLEILPFGDQTIIGERGINLSGGQKQRIQIARALYQDADIYLFDDPFSAVDAHTGSHLFKECLMALLSSKTVIYVTHQVEFLPAADIILVMKDGRITQAGKFNDIINSGTDFKDLVGAHNEALSALDSVGVGPGEKTSTSKEDNNSTSTNGAVKKADNNDVEDCKIDDLGVPKGQLVQEEEREKGYKTATILFHKMHLCIFRAPMSFFDATPSGRILNRASTDQNALDMNISNQVASFAFSMIRLLGIIAVMSQVAWQVSIIFIPVITACVWYQQYYLPSARELSRLVGVCKAPVIQHFAETISGSTTIRSFDQGSRFQDINMELIDGYGRPNFYTICAMQWLCFRLDILSSITFALFLVFLISVPEGVIDPGIAGLAVTYGLTLNTLQTALIWNLCNMENMIISVERILQYTTSIPSEPPLVIESNRPDHSWPSRGKVDMHDLQVRYAPHLPLVLRGLTCTFPGGMKTGIVGRTGSGKSTLIQTLFRIVDPDAGRILIDGIDISSIGLHDLRSNLSIIPQDPTMFEGTVRSNLDPLEEYKDEQIWEALDKCQLGDEVRKKEGKLDSAVGENGENWSMGQRQLVCLGRVLLKKSKVLVLDEATASVDTATDNLIQQTLRHHFSDCTVITIAHRISSVLDSDMVLLLSHGLLEECDSPARLLENKLSAFAQLVAEYTMRSNSTL